MALLALACSGGSDTDLTPLVVDVSGDWLGDWTESGPNPNPVTGELTFRFVQHSTGEVSGSATITNLGCASNATFQGALLDLFILGAATEAPDVDLGFEIDARQANKGATGTLLGTFVVVSGTGCLQPFNAEFLATGLPAAPAS